ncbi:MAG TPA: L-2-hydroxyglutarate oxidase [Acidimicrobiales bacterium]|jgi:L-2-hydroxyglutarate oxidase LhgO|nr:L-2-hydroxyglutarate oxidase [Acidimicrobiales bacterium]
MTAADVVVVGGGIVGLATAYRLGQARPDARITVLEKEATVGRHQSSHNSGVLHAGLYYAPGSKKAELCRRGKAAVEAFADGHGIPIVRNGKLVVAVDERELPALAALTERAEANGVPELRTLDRDELREVEPHVAGVRALHSPSTGVIDFGLVCDALASELDVRTETSVVDLVEANGGVRLTTTRGEIEARAVVVCAGLWSSQLAKRASLVTDVQIVPFRGTWLALRPSGASLVNGNIYPVPDPELPFLGVHFTRRVDGSVWSGPNAVLSLAERSVVRDALRFRGLWRLGAREARVAVREFRLSHWHRAALRELNRYVPELQHDDIEWSNRPSGVRAQAVRRDGSLVDDFVIEGKGRIVWVLNAPSPAATASLAIGEVLAGEAMTRL